MSYVPCSPPKSKPAPHNNRPEVLRDIEAQYSAEESPRILMPQSCQPCYVLLLSPNKLLSL